ncbi:MAG: hypothetical protein A2V90_06140 [Gammaproteobacteria bacterium RBG_16_57_12]|nr:MAG: hypothetical protein A2V90_06140 [Gammaproteobacteria bacterium RBG_16_57_12]
MLDIADGKAYPVISMQTEDGTQATSQCTYTSESTARTIGLLVKFSSSEINPPTKAEFIESQIAAEYMSAGDDLASAIAAGPDIQGLGDLAFSYKLMRSNLHVFWARHYQMVVMTSGNVSAEKALKINERIAQQVLKAFPG